LETTPAWWTQLNMVSAVIAVNNSIFAQTMMVLHASYESDFTLAASSVRPSVFFKNLYFTMKQVV